MNDDPRYQPTAATTAPTTTSRSAPDEQLARCKRASLRNQALRAVWQLGALVRRAEHEAPEVHRRLRSAVEALQLLSARLGMEHADESSSRPGPAPLCESLRPDGLPTGSHRRAEFF